jgi:hypothetical protein
MITVDLFESDFSKKPNHTTKTVAEGIQADYLTQVFDQILDGELDAYDVMNHPRGSAQEHVAMVLQDMYDDVARDHRLHPDDNFEEILDIVVDRIEKDYGHSTEQGVAEGSNDTIFPNAEVIKSRNGRPVGEIYQDENGWGFFHYRMDSGNDFIDSREDAIEGLRDLHQETVRSRPDYTIKGVAEGSADTVMFEIDSENAYNHVMKQFGSVVEWHGDTMVAPRKYWGSIQELAYSAGGEATEVGNEQGMAEEYNPEYDDEAGMADNNLETLERAVAGIDDLIQAGDNLPEWCQEKIAVAKSMLVAVWDYMESEEDSEEVDPEIDEMFEVMDLLAEELAAKHKVDVDTVWESFEALDDHMLYETAAWRRKEGKSKSGGLNAKGVASYRRENPGSKLQTAVTTKPSKLKSGSKAAKRRKSFCARMSGVKGPMKKPNGKPTRKALALRKWNC